MTDPTYDCAVIGGGVFGLATALELARRNPMSPM
jgi:glycine/D-amino acid oxidase-like deaminating enzyme